MVMANQIVNYLLLTNTRSNNMGVSFVVMHLYVFKKNSHQIYFSVYMDKF